MNAAAERRPGPRGQGNRKAVNRFIQGLRKRWILAMLILVFLLVFDAVLINRALQQIRTDASALSQIGRERFLIERTVVVARFFVNTTNPQEQEHARGVLKRAADLMKEGYTEILSSLSEGRLFSASFDEIRAVLSEPPYALGRKIEHFTSAILKLAEAPNVNLGAGNIHYQEIVEAARPEELPKALEFLERRFKEKSHDSITDLIRVAQGIFLFDLFVLFLITQFIFRPMARRIEAETRSLETANRSLEQHAADLESSRKAAVNLMEDAQAARRQAEEAQERLQRIVESDPNGTLIVNTSGKIVLANTMAEVLFGIKRERLLNRPIEEVLPAGSQGKAAEFLSRCFSGNSDCAGPIHDEVVIRKEDGSEIPAEMGLNVVGRGAESFAVMVFSDITERKRSEERIRKMMDSAPSSIVMVNESGRITFVNSTTERLFEYSQEEMMGESLEMLVPGIFQARGNENPERGWMTETDGYRTLGGEREFYGRRRGGGSFPIEMILSPLKTDEGTFVLTWILDITERKRIEEIRASEERFRGVIEQAGEVLFLTDGSGKFAEVNHRACESLLYTREELLGSSLADIYPAFGRQRYEELFRRLAKEKSRTLEGVLRRKDGSSFPVEIHAGLIELHEKFYMLSFARDITERKRAEQELREMSIALGNAVEGISRFDAEGNYVMVNRAYAKMLGYHTVEIYRMKWDQTIYPDDLETARKAYRHMRHSGKAEFEARAVRKDGSIFNQQIVMIQVSADGSQFSGHYCFLKDITERKYKEALDIKSELISMVAHELRTPLHSVREGISVMLEGLTGELNDEQKDVLLTTKSSLDRLVRMVNSVLDFQRLEAGIVEFHLAPNNINELIRDGLRTAEPLIKGKGLAFELALTENLPEVKVDRDRIIQVLLNLLNNAVKFTDTGKITIGSGVENGRIRVSVTDTGIGIKPEDIPRLFRKFGQLESGKVMAPGGTGLGLIISKKIIEEHGGRIEVSSHYKAGSTFSFELPVLYAAMVSGGEKAESGEKERKELV